MRHSTCLAALIMLFVGTPAVAAADRQFTLPRIAVVDVVEDKGSAVVIDDATGLRVQLMEGGIYAASFRVVAIDRERIVLRRLGTEVYYVLAVDSNPRHAKAQRPDRAPGARDLELIDPYAAEPHAAGRYAKPHADRAGARAIAPHQHGVLDPFAYGDRRPERPAWRDSRHHRPHDPYADHDDVHRRSPGAERPHDPYAQDGRAGAKAKRSDEYRGSERPPHEHRPVRDARQRQGEYPGRDPQTRHQKRPIDPFSDWPREDRSRPTAPAAPRPPPNYEQPRWEDDRPAPRVDAPAPERAQPLEIRRARLHATLADLSALERQIAIRAEGEAVRITALEPGSFVHQLGLRSGDLVERIAGRKLDSVEAAAALYAHLSRVERFAVELVRDGRPLLLEYRLVP